MAPSRCARNAIRREQAWLRAARTLQARPIRIADSAGALNVGFGYLKRALLLRTDSDMAGEVGDAFLIKHACCRRGEA